MNPNNNFAEHLSRTLAGPLKSVGAAGKGVFTQKISTDIANNIYGTGKDFFDKYADFEKRYQKALNTHLDPAKIAGVDIDFLRSGGSMNFDVLESKVRQQFRNEYMDDILKIPTILRRHGGPGTQLPSSNQYRLSVKYVSETGERFS